MIYVFLNDKAQADAFVRFAGEQPYIEQVLTKEEAAELYHLPVDQIGDYVLLTEKDSAFGECGQDILYTQESRTHGSLYERDVPLIAINPERAEHEYAYSKDVAAFLFEAAEAV